MKTTLLVIDVQRGLFETTPPPVDADAVITRINSLAARAREAGVPIVFVQHEAEGSALAYGSAKWQLDPRLTVDVGDARVRKTTPDSFLRSELSVLLAGWRSEQLVICGYASEFCIDTTTRRAAALGYPVVLVADAHTTHDKAHASGSEIRAHHNATLSAMKSFGPAITTQIAAAISFPETAGATPRGADRPALIVIDMQKCMADKAAAPRNNPGAEANIAALLGAWRSASAPVVHVRHVSRTPGSPFAPGQAGVDFQPALAPLAGEHRVEKNVPDAFVRSGLEQWLQARDIKRLVIVGVSTNNSVEATARSAGNLGFAVSVVADASFAFAKADYQGVLRGAEDVHAMALANIDGEYGRVVMTAEALSALSG